MFFSVIFITEVREPVTLKVTVEEYFRRKKPYIIDAVVLNQKRRSVTKEI